MPRRFPAPELMPGAMLRKVLGLGAHSADEILSCGGTIAFYIDAGHLMWVLIMAE